MSAALTWPVAFGAMKFGMRVQPNNRRFVSPYTRSTQVVDLIGDRWIAAVTVPLNTYAKAQAVEAFFSQLRGMDGTVALWHLARPAPSGNLRGSPSLLAAGVQGAQSLVLQNALAGPQLLLRAAGLTNLPNSSWGGFNATVTQNATAAPDGTMTGVLVSRSTTSNHFIEAPMVITSHANQPFTFSVWIRLGSLTGQVALRMRDGAGVSDIASIVVTATTTWQKFSLTGTVGASPAPSLRLFVDPQDNTGVVGDTFFVWGGLVEQGRWLRVNPISEVQPDSATAPDGTLTAYTLVRTATGNHSTYQQVPITTHAGKTYTFSIYLKLGTLAGNVTLRLRDGASAEVASLAVTPTGTWQRFVLTGAFGASPAANIQVHVDPDNSPGTVGETLLMWGMQLEEAAAATPFLGVATLKAGDMIGCSGHLLQVANDCAANDAGLFTVPLVNRLRAAISSSTPVAWDKPTALFRMSADDSAGAVMYGKAIADQLQVEFTETY